MPRQQAGIAGRAAARMDALRSMLITGCGAGLLNGETAKVSMSVVPPERGGMASGMSGTLRFVGLVTGITYQGIVLKPYVALATGITLATGALVYHWRLRSRTPDIPVVETY